MSRQCTPIFKLATTGEILTENIGHYRSDELVEELPTVASEGDTCTIHEGAYQYFYQWQDGRWQDVGTAAPWQLSVG